MPAELTPEYVLALPVPETDWTLEMHPEPTQRQSGARALLGWLAHHEASILDQGGTGTVADVVCAEDARLLVEAPRLRAALLAAWRERDDARADAERQRTMVRVVTGEPPMRILALGDGDSDDPAIHMRSWMIGIIVRELGRSCIGGGGENNLSICFAPLDDDEFHGFRFEVHTTRPGGRTPTEQRDDALAEVERLRAAIAVALRVDAEAAQDAGLADTDGSCGCSGCDALRAALGRPGVSP